MNISEILATLYTVADETPIAFMNMQTREKSYAITTYGQSHRDNHSTYAFQSFPSSSRLTAADFRETLQYELDNNTTFEWSGNMGQGPEYTVTPETEIAIIEHDRDSNGKIITWFEANGEMIFFTHAY